MGIQAFKSVEVGMGRAVAGLPGSAVHDPIGFDPTRGSGVAGVCSSDEQRWGIEGG